MRCPAVSNIQPGGGDRVKPEKLLLSANKRVRIREKELEPISNENQDGVVLQRDDMTK